MRSLTALAAMLLLFAAGPTRAEDASEATAQGRALARQLLAQHPTENYTNSGVLHIRDGSGNQTDVPVRCEITVTTTNWSTTYEATLGASQTARLCVVHTPDELNAYYYRTNKTTSSPLLLGTRLSSRAILDDFAGSDFWITDLGQEFLHWPQQKLLKKEIKRTRGCSVLESTNPQPTPGGYSRVVSWIDNDGGGLVQAFAYDADNQVLKEFYPKDIKQVNGQWQVGRMEMNNDQTGSRTRLDFDLTGSASPQK